LRGFANIRSFLRPSRASAQKKLSLPIFGLIPRLRQGKIGAAARTRAKPSQACPKFRETTLVHRPPCGAGGTTAKKKRNLCSGFHRGAISFGAKNHLTTGLSIFQENSFSVGLQKQKKKKKKKKKKKTQKKHKKKKQKKKNKKKQKEGAERKTRPKTVKKAGRGGPQRLPRPRWTGGGLFGFEGGARGRESGRTLIFFSGRVASAPKGQERSPGFLGITEILWGRVFFGRRNSGNHGHHQKFLTLKDFPTIIRGS